MTEDSLFDLEARAPKLAPAPVIVESDSVCPAMLEYTPLGATEVWRVERFEMLAAEFGLNRSIVESLNRSTVQPFNGWVTEMALFHEVAAENARGFLMVRRLFGVMPLLPAPGSQAEDFSVWTHQRLAEEMGIGLEQLQAEVAAVRVAWERAGKLMERELIVDGGPNNQPSTPPPSTLVFGDEVLAKYGFVDAMFEIGRMGMDRKTIEPRPTEENRRERDLFASWVGAWARMFDEPMSEPVAREALLNRLYLRRLEVEQARVPQSHPEFERMERQRQNLATAMAGQLEKLEQMFPEMGGIAGKVSFRAVISELNRGYREYYGNADRRLVDKIRTAAEVEVELRQSVQDPQVRMRFGLNVAILDAMQGLFDPNWRPRFKPAVLKKLDAAFRRGVEEARAASGEALVDLEAEGERGEYGALEKI